MAGRLAGRAAIITGAGSGIGRRCAERFAAEGAAVTCVDLDGDAATQTAAAVADAGGRALPLAVDVTDLADTERMAAETLAAFGTIDVLLANAGIAGPGSTATCDPTVWDRVVAVNLTGVWLSMRAVLPTMVAAGAGSIVATASVAGVTGIRGIAPYTASKAGVIGLCRATAVEVGPAGVRVNALAPGTTMTPLVEQTFATFGAGDGGDDGRTARTLANEQARYPLRRFGELDEVVDAALFLASDDSSWVTGTVQVVDGGLTAA